MNLKLNLEDKMIYPGVINLTQFTSGTDTLVFLMPDYVYQTTDLSQMDCYAVCDMPITEEEYRVNEVKLHSEIIDDILQIKWDISGYTTSKAGTITYQIVFKNKENQQTKLWSSDRAIIFINSSVNTDGMLAAMYPDIFMQWEDRMKQTDKDSKANLGETMRQVGLAENAAKETSNQVELAKEQVKKAVEEAKKSEQESNRAKDQADKAKQIELNIEKLIGYDSVDLIGQEVMQARGTHNLIGDRFDEIELDVSKTENKYQELQNVINSLKSFELSVVNVLPIENIKLNTIYFVPKIQSENDSYDEYIYINDNWEHIGSTSVDLTGYYTKDEVEQIINQTKENSHEVILMMTEADYIHIADRKPNKLYFNCTGLND